MNHEKGVSRLALLQLDCLHVEGELVSIEGLLKAIDIAVTAALDSKKNRRRCLEAIDSCVSAAIIKTEEMRQVLGRAGVPSAGEGKSNG